jgi:hypothetical protein
MTVCIRCGETILDSDPREQTDDPSTWFDHLDWPADGHAAQPISEDTAR